MTFSGLDFIVLIPGEAAKAVKDHLPIEYSPATPVNTLLPVKDEDGVTPKLRFIKADGVFNEVKLEPLHSASPCPNLALKSPSTRVIGTFLNLV